MMVRQPAEKIRVLVDARQADRRDESRYEPNLVGALSRRDDIALSILATPNAYDALRARGSIRNATYLEATEPPFSARGDFELNRAYEHAEVDVFHSLRYCMPRRVRLDRPVIATIPDLVALADPLSMPDVLKRLVFAGRNRKALQRASWVIAPTQATASDIKCFFPEIEVPITVVPNAADDLGVTPLREPTVAGAYVLAPGTLRAHKNLETLIGAMDVLRSTHPDIHLLLIGPRDRAWLKEQLGSYPTTKDLIHFTGQVDDASLRAFYRDARAFLLPSYAEGFAREALEAAAFSVPVIAADVPALAETLKDAAVLVDPYDCTAWASAIGAVCDSEEYARDLGKKARTRAELFSWERTAERTVDVYRDALVALGTESSDNRTSVMPAEGIGQGKDVGDPAL